MSRLGFLIIGAALLFAGHAQAASAQDLLGQGAVAPPLSVGANPDWGAHSCTTKRVQHTYRRITGHRGGRCECLTTFEPTIVAADQAQTCPTGYYLKSVGSPFSANGDWDGVLPSVSYTPAAVVGYFYDYTCCLP